jgi:hypothetical protein
LHLKQHNSPSNVQQIFNTTTSQRQAAASHLDSFVSHHLECSSGCVIQHPRPQPPKKGAKAALAVQQSHSLRNAKFPANFSLSLQAGLDDIKGIGNLKATAVQCEKGVNMMRG